MPYRIGIVGAAIGITVREDSQRMIYEGIDANVGARLNFRSNWDELMSRRILPVYAHFVAAVVENLDMTRYRRRGRSWQGWVGVRIRSRRRGGCRRGREQRNYEEKSV